MFRKGLNFLFLFVYFIFVSPVYSNEISSKAIEKYTLTISKSFSKKFCNSSKFGISNDGAMRFSIGETNKEFLNNKLNKFVDYELLKNDIVISLQNDCQKYDFSIDKLENLVFK